MHQIASWSAHKTRKEVERYRAADQKRLAENILAKLETTPEGYLGASLAAGLRQHVQHTCRASTKE